MPGTHSKELIEFADILLKTIHNETWSGFSDSAMIGLITYLCESDPSLFVDDIADDEEEENNKKRRIKNNRAENLWHTPWGKLLKDLANEETPNRNYLLKKFRRRFRIPYELFLLHVKEANEVNLFDIVNETKICVEL